MPWSGQKGFNAAKVRCLTLSNAVSTLFQRRSSTISTRFQRGFSTISTLFQLDFNAILLPFQRCRIVIGSLPAVKLSVEKGIMGA